VRAVRESCGVFDVSHMGQLDITGPDLTAALNHVVSADWSTVDVGRVAYALLLNEHGGVIDDVMGYRVGADEWFVVVNASRADVDEPHLRKHLPQLTIANRYQDQAMLAIQGPHAEKLLQPLTDITLSLVQRRDCLPAKIAGASGFLARGGYTGTDGFEFMFRAGDAPHVWRELLKAGVVPCGLGARDVLRLEAALPLYGHELREEWTPYESGCGFAVKMAKADFIGREALAHHQTPGCRIRALRMEGRMIPREGYPVVWCGVEGGQVTSGTMSPTVGGGIALALVPSALQIGDTVEVQIRGTLHPATVVKPPFVPHHRRSE
jgi:aminomethyltransferase